MIHQRGGVVVRENVFIWLGVRQRGTVLFISSMSMGVPPKNFDTCTVLSAEPVTTRVLFAAIDTLEIAVW